MDARPTLRLVKDEQVSRSVHRLHPMHVMYAGQLDGKPQFYPMPRTDLPMGAHEVISWMLGVIRAVTGLGGYVDHEVERGGYHVTVGNQPPISDLDLMRVIDVLGGAMQTALAIKLRDA